MKLFIISSAVLLALSQAKAADTGPRILRRHSKGGKYAARIQRMVNNTCPDFDCDGVDVDNLHCALEKPTEFNMDEKEERRQKILECACCAGMSAKDILGGDGPSTSSGDGSDEDSSSDSPGDNSDAEAADTGSRFLRRHSKGGKYAARIQRMVNNTCPYFDCDEVDVDNLDCTLEKPTEFNMDEKDERRQKILECACCAGMSVKDILRGNGPSTSSGDGSDEDSAADSSDNSDAEAADTGSRFLRRHSKGGKYAARIRKMVNNTCPDFDCDGVNVDNLDCTLEKPTESSMDEKDERRQKILECACCAGMSVKDILGGDGPSSSSGDSSDGGNSDVDGTGDSNVRK